MKTKKLLTSKQAAKSLNVSRQTLSRYNLPKKVKIGNKDYYNQADIEEILQNGLEPYLEHVESVLNDKSSNSTVGEDLADLGNKMKKQINSIMENGDYERLLRIAFEFDALSELMELVIDVQYTAIFQTNDPDADPLFTDIDFFPCVENCSYEEHIQVLAEMANDVTNHIIRYNVLPTPVFKALYREYLVYLFFDTSEIYDKDKYKDPKEQLLNFMFPFHAESDKVVMAKKIK